MEASTSADMSSHPVRQNDNTAYLLNILIFIEVLTHDCGKLSEKYNVLNFTYLVPMSTKISFSRPDVAISGRSGARFKTILNIFCTLLVLGSRTMPTSNFVDVGHGRFLLLSDADLEQGGLSDLPPKVAGILCNTQSPECGLTAAEAQRGQMERDAI